MRDVVVRSTILTVVYAALGSVVLWPLCNYSELASSLYLGDVRLNAWTLAWNNHAMLDGVPSYWNANIFYPATQTLALSEHLFGISLFSLPVYAATRNPALSYNVVWLFSFPASAVAAHWLAWRYTRDHLASMLAGVIYAFCFFKILHGGGHLQIVWSFWLPVAILLLAWWFERPRLTTSLALAAVITLQVLSSWYIGVLILFATIIFFVWQAAAVLLRLRLQRRAPESAPLALRRRAMQLALIVILCSAAIWPFATPYLHGTLESAPEEIRDNSARVSDYVLPPAHTWGGRVAAAAGAYGLNLPYGERAVFVGYVALGAAVLAIAVLASPRAGPRTEPSQPDRRTELWCLVAIAAVAFACSLGPAAADGRGAAGAAGAAGAVSVADWTPFGLISHVPGLSLFRAPARFALLVMLAVAVLAAFAARWWQDRWGPAGRVLTALLIPVAVSESFLIGSPIGRPEPAPIPPMYALLATLPAGPVVSLPGYREPGRWWPRANYQVLLDGPLAADRERLFARRSAGSRVDHGPHDGLSRRQQRQHHAADRRPLRRAPRRRVSRWGGGDSGGRALEQRFLTSPPDWRHVSVRGPRTRSKPMSRRSQKRRCAVAQSRARVLSFEVRARCRVGPMSPRVNLSPWMAGPGYPREPGACVRRSSVI